MGPKAVAIRSQRQAGKTQGQLASETGGLSDVHKVYYKMRETLIGDYLALMRHRRGADG
jgi:hypothetical protein